MNNNANINKKILIFEDDKDYFFILQESFKREGFTVIGAQNGEEGLLLIEKEKPDLILLDIMMPVMDGLQVAQKIKEKNITTPVIFLTHLKDADSISKALEIIPSDYIIKSDMPIDKIIAEIKKKLGIS
jgi:two-component system alkaline phosphatase synthesis response regulator PhoP